MDNIDNQYTLYTKTIPWFTTVTGSITYQKKVVAYPIQIKWKAADRTSTAASAPTSEPIKHSGGLSTGAKAGIGVSVGLVALAIISFIVWWCLRKKSFPRSEEEDHSPGHETSVYPKAEMDANAVAAKAEMDANAVAPKAEMDANAVARFRDSGKPSELVGDQVYPFFHQ